MMKEKVSTSRLIFYIILILAGYFLIFNVSVRSILPDFNLQKPLLDLLVTSLKIVLMLSFFIAINRFYKPPLFLFGKTRPINYLYIIPVVIVIPLTSNAFALKSQLSEVDKFDIGFIVFGMQSFAIPLFEEIIFRGLILGLLLVYFYEYNKWLINSIIVSSILFGVVHLFNILTTDMNLLSVINQMWFAFSYGFLFATLYLVIRNLIVVVFIHFLLNFPANMNSFIAKTVPVTNNIVESRTKSLAELVFNEILVFAFYSIPLLIAWAMLTKKMRNEIELNISD